MKSLTFVIIGLGSLFMCSCQRVMKQNWEPEKPQCYQDCDPVYKPICAGIPGSDNSPRTFGNKCQLDVYNCLNPNNLMTSLYPGYCKNNQKVLPHQTKSRRRLFPNQSKYVCAGNNVTPPQTLHLSQLKLYNRRNSRNRLQILYFDKCNQDCDISCAAVYEPVCAGTRDGWYPLMTFSNMCEWNVFKCKNPQDEMILYYCGACQFCDRETKPCSLLLPYGCPDVYEPFCVLNQYGDKMTFANSCELSQYICANQTMEFQVVCVDVCENCPQDLE